MLEVAALWTAGRVFDALTLKKTDPLVLRILDPFLAQWSVQKSLLLWAVAPVGEKPQSVVSLWIAGMLSIGLSLRPEGLWLVQKDWSTSQQVCDRYDARTSLRAKHSVRLARNCIEAWN